MAKNVKAIDGAGIEGISIAKNRSMCDRLCNTGQNK